MGAFSDFRFLPAAKRRPMVMGSWRRNCDQAKALGEKPLSHSAPQAKSEEKNWPKEPFYCSFERFLHFGGACGVRGQEEEERATVSHRAVSVCVTCVRVRGVREVELEAERETPSKGHS